MSKQKQKKTIMVTAMFLYFTAMVCIPSITMAGDLEPSGAPASTMKTLDEVEPRIPISSVPYIIGQSGSYYFTGNLTSATSGITITVSNVTIDLMGYSLIGAGGSGAYDGIYASSRNNIEIRNGTVTDFPDYGILLAGGSQNRIINMRVTLNDDAGVYITSTNSLVKDCTVGDNNNSFGIYASGGGCTITGNTAYSNNGIGIYVTGGSGSTVTGNTAYSNTSTGIYGQNGCTITGNTAYDNPNIGIGGSGSTLTGNTAYSNGTGISTAGENTIIGNTARYNGRNGIDPGNDSLIDQNTATNNNQLAGGFANIDACATCTFGLNHAP